MVGPDIRPYLERLDLPTRPDQDVIDAHAVPGVNLVCPSPHPATENALVYRDQ